MDVTKLNNNFLNILLKKKIEKQKKVFLIDDFSFDLMHYNEQKPTNDFFRFTCLQLLLPISLIDGSDNGSRSSRIT